MRKEKDQKSESENEHKMIKFLPYIGVRSLIALRGSFFPGEGTNAVSGEEIFVETQPLFRRLGSFIR